MKFKTEITHIMKERNTALTFPGRASAAAVYILMLLCPWGELSEELHIAPQRLIIYKVWHQTNPRTASLC